MNFNKNKTPAKVYRPPTKQTSITDFLSEDSIIKPQVKKSRLHKDNANNPWYFNGKPFTEMKPGFYGFVYVLINKVTNQKYIGKKFFISVSGKGKKAIRKESNWKSYWSSSSIIKAEIKKYGKDNFKREILILCREKRDVDLQEVRLLWHYNVLGSQLPSGDPEFYNDNISGRYYRRDELFDKTARIYSNNLIK